MRNMIGFLSIALVVGGCVVEQTCPSEGEDEASAIVVERTKCADFPEDEEPGGDSVWWNPNHYWDEQGICRSKADFHSLGCAPTFDLALADPGHCGGIDFVCAGSCGDWLVVHYACTPSVGCTYDPLTRALVGVRWGDDVPVNCGEKSWEVIYGDGYHDCQFTDLVVQDGCWFR